MKRFLLFSLLLVLLDVSTGRAAHVIKALPAITEFAYALPAGINVSAEMSKEVSSVNCPTSTVNVNGKMQFTSGKIVCPNDCNKLRFTLSESTAFYSNEKNRFSFDSFKLYDGNGDEISLRADWFSGNYNKPYANMLDGTNGTYCCGAWGSSDEGHDYFEIVFPEDIELGGAFSFSFVTENTTMNTKAFTIDLMHVEQVKYTLHLSGVPENTKVSVTYNDKTYSEGDEIIEGFDVGQFSATRIPGYIWEIVVDDEAKTITLCYSEAVIATNPQSVVALANRIGGAGTADKFLFVLDPSLNQHQETFLLGAKDGKVLVKGTTLSAITTGLGWYLNYHANINIAWNALNEKAEGEAYTDLSNLPLPSSEEVHSSDAKYRYYLNYCTFGYSMTTWTWKRWQQEIDWMALHGINMPLQIVGLEEVWRMFLTMKDGATSKYNYTDTEAKAFVAGPAFTAWWGMNNLEGWGGTASSGWNGVQDDAWYARQKSLAGKILSRQRELGMDPVLPGFSGMVPSNFTTKTGVATDANGGSWLGFTRPRIIDPTADRFADIAADYYVCLKEVMGESRYYSMDPFHEGGGISSGKYAEAYTAVYDAMEQAKSGSQWVIQQWQWNASQRLSLNAVPAGKLIVLDLFSDGKPAFDGYNGYAPQEAVFCAIPNFGGRSGVMGRLNNLASNYFHFMAKYSSIKGIGAAPEAIEQTPVTYDLLFQLPWMGEKPDMAAWVKNYATMRYGTDNKVAQEAWELLRMGVLNYGADAIQGPVEDVWGARPNLDASPASTWGKTLNHAGGIYTRARRQMLIDATYKLLGVSEKLGLEDGSAGMSNYNYDLVEFGGAVMADYAYDLLLAIKSAKNAAGDNFATDATYMARRDAFLSLIADMDVFKGTNLNFRLGKWTQEARDAAAEVAGATTATPDWYEFNNARTLITTWGDKTQNGGLKDYSYRSWQGMLKDYYLPRWKYFFDNNCSGTNYFFFEWNWAHGMQHSVGQTAKSTVRLTEGQPGYSYSRTPEGNTVEEAHRLLNKYIIPIISGEGTYYAYRYVDNDLSATVTIVANAGDVLDLTAYFGQLENVTLSGDFMADGSVDMSNVVVKADATDGNHTGTIVLADGTKLSFTVVLNPAYYGTYHIDYKDGGSDAPVFIAYNEDEDNAKNKGYKLIATGTYSAEAEADRIFTVKPNGAGFSLSAQGKSLKSPTLSAWQHVMFSDEAQEAGAYIFEVTNTEGVYKVRSTGNGINYINHYANGVFGNDNASKPNLSTFTITPVSTFTLDVPETGMTALCLPFSVILPEGVTAYDCNASGIVSDAEGKYTCTLQAIAESGDVLRKGTPVVIKANAGEYTLGITMADMEAKTSIEGSAFCGNYVSQMLTPADAPAVFVLAEVENRTLGFSRMTETAKVAPNSCRMEWTLPAEHADLDNIAITFGQSVAVGDVLKGETNSPLHLIYNIGGQRLRSAQKGLNIVDGKKVVVQ